MFEKYFKEDVALIFSGGGGRGAYEIGVWKALMDLGVNIKGAFGTSVGSINSAAVAMNDFELGRKIWLQMEYKDVMKVDKETEIVLRGDLKQLKFKYLIHTFFSFVGSKGIDVSPLKDMLKNIIDEDKIRNSVIDFGLVTYSVSDFKPFTFFKEEIPEGEMIDYIIASSNFPLFEREEINGQKFIDGGVYNNIPIELAQKKGYSNMIVVDIGTHGVKDFKNLLTKFKVGNEEVLYIKPREHYGTVMTFNVETSKKYMVEGYLDTMGIFRKVFGKKYYISDLNDPIYRIFSLLNSEDRKDALKILGISSKSTIKNNCNYQYYREVFPFFESILGLQNSEGDLLVLNLLELIAEKLKLYKLDLYSSDYFFYKIASEEYKEDPIQEIKDLINFNKMKKVFEFIKFLYKKTDFEYENSKSALKESILSLTE